MRTLKAIILDMDGTIADTEDIHRQAFNTAFDELKVSFHWRQKEYKQLLAISGGRERLRQYLLMHMTSSGRTESLLDLADRLHDRKSEIYRQMLIDGHVGLRPGIRRLIHEAKAEGITLAIATSSSAKNVETLLKVALDEDALSLFSTIVTCDTVIEKKPAAAVYLFVLNKLELDPRHCIALEDTRNGNLAAMGAGLKTVITTHLFTTDNDFTGAALVVDQLGEPDRPAGVISGSLFGQSYVDVNLLEQLLMPSDGLLMSG